MRIRSTSLVVIVAMVVSLFPSGQVRAMPTHETIYTQHYNCILSPPPDVVGEWVSGCHNEWYGWGWEPGHSCTYTVESEGESCIH